MIKVFGTILFCGLLIAILSVSCKHGNQYAKETSSLDSLNKVLDSTIAKLNKVDTVKIKKSVENVIVTMDYVKMYNKDNISSGATDILKNFSAVRWALHGFIAKQSVIKREMQKSIAQNEHLSHDLRNNLIKKDSAMIFYSFEVKKATELIETAKYGLQMVKMQQPIYDIIAPQADSLVNRLKNHEKI